ncbi:MAG: hypothetical protein AAF515_03915 [Pseudomonadota bacterium]
MSDQQQATEIVEEPTAEQLADQQADQRVAILVFCALVAIAVVFISGYTPQF